jgi:hypothetical protein
MTRHDRWRDRRVVVPGEVAGFDWVMVDGIEVPMALFVQFLLESDAQDVDIANFSAALAPGQASGLLPWARANDISFERLLRAIETELRPPDEGGRRAEIGSNENG